MKSGKWFGLKRTKPGESKWFYEWPESTRQMWRSQLKDRLGCGIRKFFKGIRGDLERISPSPSIYIFFPKDVDMSGHLASIRKVWENVQLVSYGCWLDKRPMRIPGLYAGTGAVVIWTRHVLRKMAELSPVFEPIWEDLKDLPSGECGIYLADEPPAAWQQSIQADDRRLYAEFRDAQDLDRIGLDQSKPEEEAIDQHLEAHFLLSEERYPEAEAVLERMLIRWPGFWRAYLDLAASALAQENPQRAYAVVRRVQKRYPDCLHFDRMAVDCCVAMRDWRRAEWHLKRLWGLNPWDPNLLRRYAQVAFEQQDYRLAVQLAEACAEHAPLPQWMRTHQAVALAKINRAPEALAIFKDLEKHGDKSPMLLNNIGILLAGLGRPLEGLDYCRRALALGPNLDCAWDSLGFAHLKIGNYSEATKAFLKTIELSPAFPDAWRHLLHAYHKGGDAERLEGAKAYVRRVLPEQLARFDKERGTDIPA